MANPGHSGDVEWVCVLDPTFAPDPSMPDRLPRAPFDAVTDPEPPEATPNRPPHAPPGAEEYALQIKETADKLLKDHASRGDVKLIATAVRELRYCFKVFASYRGRRKATVFGSAR